MIRKKIYVCVVISIHVLRESQRPREDKANVHIIISGESAEEYTEFHTLFLCLFPKYEVELN